MHFSMDLRRLPISKPASLFYPIKRPLTGWTFICQRRHEPPHSTSLQPPSPPQPPNQSLLNWVSSILSSPSLDSSKCKSLIPLLCPHEFDRLFYSIRSNVNPKTALHFFYVASQSFKLRFTARSFCVLVHLLIASNLGPSARLLLIRLIDGNVPVLYAIPNSKHIEIAIAMSELNTVSQPALGIQTLDMLIHVYCTQFKNLGFGYAIDVFEFFSNKGAFPSLKTCNFLLSSLVKANELDKSYHVFEVMTRGVSPDVFLFTTAINAYFKGGKVDDAIALFSKMEGLGIAPNVVTYNSVIHGLCQNRRLEAAFHFKEKMIENNENPSFVTYSVLINSLIKLDKFYEANCVLKEMRIKGFVPNEVVYNTLIDGYCTMGNIGEALKIRDDMVSNGATPNSVTLNSLLHGLCKSNQFEHAEQVLDKMLASGLSVNQVVCFSVIHWLCMKSRFDSALKFTTEILLRNFRPSDSLLTTLFVGLCKDGKNSEAMELWFRLLEKGFAANTATSNTLIHGLCESGSIQEVVRLLKAMLERGLALD
ncbi:hypothetical protein M0R45_025437 [Rubus argutus]|uniref:Pentatricopeptide repeat-containing protein n=1 Tax=Rubus argutus TaxID=59490 RepID=A0AAW1WVZ8_RUBAR